MHELLLLSSRFHGIEPSKKSKEKIQRKVRDEMAAKKAATSEQPAGTLNHLKHAQVPHCHHKLPILQPLLPVAYIWCLSKFLYNSCCCVSTFAPCIRMHQLSVMIYLFVHTTA